MFGTQLLQASRGHFQIGSTAHAVYQVNDSLTELVAQRPLEVVRHHERGLHASHVREQELFVHATRSNQCRVQLLGVVRGHDQNSVGRIHHPIKSVQDPRQIQPVRGSGGEASHSTRGTLFRRACHHAQQCCRHVVRIITHARWRFLLSVRTHDLLCSLNVLQNRFWRSRIHGLSLLAVTSMHDLRDRVHVLHHEDHILETQFDWHLLASHVVAVVKHQFHEFRVR
mmetsp:Transcript_1989/g.5660  ORF Transcript_1989/g.5660 Transcript_1989/m.5660 type:complete len:226 (+) Transcript_1989:249-926(+)